MYKTTYKISNKIIKKKKNINKKNRKNENKNK